MLHISNSQTCKRLSKLHEQFQSIEVSLERFNAINRNKNTNSEATLFHFNDLSNQTNIMLYFKFTHPEDRRLGLRPSLLVERGRASQMRWGESRF